MNPGAKLPAVIIVQLTQNGYHREEGIPSEGQRAEDKAADAEQSAGIHKETPRNQTQERHELALPQTTKQQDSSLNHNFKCIHVHLAPRALESRINKNFRFPTRRMHVLRMCRDSVISS